MKTINKISDLTKEDLLQIMEYSHDEIFVVDRNCRIVYVNNVCRRTYGAEPEEIIGKNINEMIEKGYYSPPLAPSVIKEKKAITVEQVTNLGIKLLVTATPFLDENGEVIMVVMNSRDITELEQLKYDAEETKKLIGHYKNEINTMHRDELALSGIISRDTATLDCFHMAKRIAKTDANVLLLGESGVGKNIMADYIHKVSHRNFGPFIPINCAAIPENLLESELFGYCEGAFSGANRNGKPGLVEIANHGTLFLDEIGELPLTLQTKLLQLVQEKTFMPIGGKALKKTDIRIITATNRNLNELVKRKKFREDLYYRLNVIEITLPPLRERKTDIPLLCANILARTNSKYKTYGVIDPTVYPIFQRYSWPGNIRELEHTIERLVLTIDNDIITSKHLPQNILDEVQGNKKQTTDIMEKQQDIETEEKKSQQSYKEIEIEHVLSLYEKLKSSYKVAKELNISQSKATRIINKYKDK